MLVAAAVVHAMVLKLASAQLLLALPLQYDMVVVNVPGDSLDVTQLSIGSKRWEVFATERSRG